jgi:hypothetical protein
MKIYVCFKYFLSLLILVFFPVAGASAFAVPEKLVYNITWAGIKAGTATLEISSTDNAMRIISTARSSDWVSVFYTVDDWVEAIISKPVPPEVFGVPLNYRMKIREGRRRRDKEVAFDHLRHKAACRDYIDGEKRNVDIRGKTLDPLSSLYYMRLVTPEVGKPFFVDVFDDMKAASVEVRVLGRERIRTGLGYFDTIVIKPLFKSEGIFNRRGDIYIWFTDDRRHIPVKMQTKVRLGHITATLAGGNY